ncbi:cell wall hydrolase SleB protein [Candidatus Micropelagos thuwalensis]|jgi:flagellar motor switch protein FliN/FliY|uniref:Flagellar motor switch protein FliN n=1 Tax=Candidatus Micropelagius thuwalensis TaxID=1397666 RepID=U2XU27_9PROT|nr:cell wall hydrolase SleB protein [Candidatus Micropelagos thuwalensis]
MSETDQDTIEEQDADATENVEAAADESQAVNEQAAAPKNEKVSVENLRVLENIEVNLTVVVGGTELKIRDLLRLNEGSVIELDRLAGDPLDILANGIVIAKGEVVMIGERFGIRFTEIVDPEKRVENL